jgi:hypothetical protein
MAKDLSEEIIGLFEVGREGFKEIKSGNMFTILYVTEPTIRFRAYSSTMFPRDFLYLRTFYTSRETLSADLVFFYKREDSDLVNKLFSLVKIYLEKNKGLNFNLNMELKPAVDLYNNVLQVLKGGVGVTSSNIIVGVATPRLGGARYWLVKAYSIIAGIPTHIINTTRLNEIVQECRKKGVEPENCPGFTAYALNNLVQLYAKAGGIPWAPGEEGLLQDKVVIGLATSPMTQGYAVGVAYAVAYVGKEIRSFITTATIDVTGLDMDMARSRGIYIPKKVIAQLLSKISEYVSSYRIRGYVIFQSPIVLEEEIEGISSTLKGVPWILVHVKAHGFVKRIFDTNTDDWGPYRGLCVVNNDYLDKFKDYGVIKALLLATGKIKLQRRSMRGVESKEELLYVGTPKPLELEIFVDKSSTKNYDPKALTAYVSRLILLLGKLDWEAYVRWPKEPFVIKYARRMARIIARVDNETRGALLNVLSKKVFAHRYIM